MDDGSVYWQMSLDEALLTLRATCSAASTVRIYFMKPSAVTIGYFQRLRDSVDLEYAEALGIPVVRRITGGGSVYHDEKGEVTYSIVARVGEVPADAVECFRVVCGGLVRAIGHLGLHAEYKPVNDVVIGSKKVSGSAMIRRGDAILVHGTLMYGTDLEVLSRVLKAPSEKLRDKGVSSIYERVTTLGRELGRRLSRQEVVNALVRGFQEALGVRLVPGELTRAERELAENLVHKYSSREWNQRR